MDWLSWCAEAEPSALELLAIDDHRVRAASKLATLDPSTGRSASTPQGSVNGTVASASVMHGDLRSQVAIDPQRFDREVATIRRTGGALPEQSALAVALHKELATDLFVTSDEAMLLRRWTPHTWMAVVSPLEAEEIVRSSFFGRADECCLTNTLGGVMHVDFHPYASDSARAMMPATRRATAALSRPARMPTIR